MFAESPPRPFPAHARLLHTLYAQPDKGIPTMPSCRKDHESMPALQLNRFVRFFSSFILFFATALCYTVKTLEYIKEKFLYKTIIP